MAVAHRAPGAQAPPYPEHLWSLQAEMHGCGLGSGAVGLPDSPLLGLVRKSSLAPASASHHPHRSQRTKGEETAPSLEHTLGD